MSTGSNPPALDYDQLAAEYASHRRVDAALVRKLSASGRVNGSSRVLEIGCGTGNYVAALAEATGASCTGVDPSAEMLAVAATRAPGVATARAAAEALPFDGAQFDFAFSVDVVHHLADPPAYFREAYRVLAGGGTLVTVTDDERTIRACLHARYFPEMVAIELGRYPALTALRAGMQTAGFVDVRESIYVSSYEVCDAAPYRAKAFSSLHLIPTAAFARGLERLERDLETGPVRAEMKKVVLSGLRDT